jgi:hypothetical protein
MEKPPRSAGQRAPRRYPNPTSAVPGAGVGVRLLRIPIAMVLEHPDEFVRKVMDAIGTSVEKARK